MLFTSPEQRTYELIRPVVLFGVPPKERAQETGTAARTVYRNVQRFVEHGMELTRFRGQAMIGAKGIHNAEVTPALSTGVPAAHR